MALYSGDTIAAYKLPHISLKYDTISAETYPTSIGELFNGTLSITYTKVISIPYQILFIKDNN